MKAKAWLLLPASPIVLDVGVVALGFASARTPAGIAAIAIGHLVVALGFGFALRLTLLRKGREAGLRMILLGGSLAFFVPVIGSAALVAAIYTLLVTRPKVEAIPFQRYAPPDTLLRRAPTELRPRVLVDRLVYLVRHGRTIDTRFKAVLQTNDAPAVVAVPVLKAALADTAEEVRLSAFSQLEKTRRGIDLRIQRGQEALKGSVPADRAQELHAGLAQDYYEIAYLGLAEGEVFKQAIKSALTHADEALALAPKDAATLRLVARLRLRQSGTGESTESVLEALDAAAAAGMPFSELAADYAEEAFRRRAFPEVAKILAALGDVAHDHVVLAKVQEFWRWQ